jgi:hypothetical protein
MEHAEAARLGAVERYLLQDLDEALRLQFEEHLFDCEECAADVRVTATFLDNARAELGPPRKARAPLPSRRPWSLLFWPVPAAAMVSVAALTGLLTYQTARRPAADAPSGSIRSAPSHFLSVSRSGPPTVSACPEEREVVLTLSQTSTEAFPYFRCELQDSSGRTLLSGTVPAALPGEELRVLLPVRSLEPGSFTLVLHGMKARDDAQPREAARYPFLFTHPGGCP